MSDVMFKAKTKEVAESMAAARSLHYGWSVFDGGYYIGTVSQLINIGCQEIIGPTPCASPRCKYSGRSIGADLRCPTCRFIGQGKVVVQHGHPSKVICETA